MSYQPPAGQARAFLRASRCYWLEIFPLTRRERRHWRSRALAIPDTQLRRDAIFTLDTKWGHSEGAAAFAVLVPRTARHDFIRMAIAYQVMLDYLDTTSEHRVADPFANTMRLHGALAAALSLETPRADYYATHPHRDDGGYLTTHISVCRKHAESLPGIPSAREQAHRLVALYAEAQGLFHAATLGLNESARARFTLSEAARHPQLAWGEILAAGGSSLPLFALLAAATSPSLSAGTSHRIVSAYYPCPAALHISLDGLIDWDFDRFSGHAGQIAHYHSHQEAAARLAHLASHAALLLGKLPRGELHTTILAGMAGYYLAHPGARAPEARQSSAGVLDALGAPARIALLVHRCRRGLHDSHLPRNSGHPRRIPRTALWRQ